MIFQKIIDQREVDYVSLCRLFILEPELIAKIKSVAKTESGYINCNDCLIGVADNPVKCYYEKL